MMIFCTIFMVALMSIAAHDYCSIDCEGNQHTMCAYPVNGGGECREYERGLTHDERMLIVAEHNRYRQRVAQGLEDIGPQPPAANMMQLTWDTELAEIAQRWAEQCHRRGHDKCRKTHDRTYIGQNIYSGGGYDSFNKTGIIVKGLKEFYDEVKYVSPSMVSSFKMDQNFKRLGHYTQMVWATTSRVGCGMSFLLSTDPDVEPYDFRLVCNYKEGGNMEPKPIYKEGPACSDCPEGTGCSHKYSGLCIRHSHNS